MAKDGTRRGRPKGSKGKKTLEKEAARELLRELVKANMGAMVEAQIANAKGLKFLVLRHAKSGKFIKRIEDGKGAVVLDKEHEIIEVWGKDPSVQAFTDLMNRTIDKPIEQVASTVDHSGVLEIKWEK
jgi:hypothetical protein